MARRTQPVSTSPNKVLVIILVFLVLSNIGFGVWVYAANKDKDKWDNRAKDLDKKVKESEQTSEWHRFQRDELLAAIGEPEFNKKPDAVKAWRENREFFLKQPPQKFKGEEGDVEFLAIMKKFLEPNLDGFDDKDGRYKTRFAEIKDPLENELKRVQKQLASEVLKNNAKQQEFLALEKRYNADRDAMLKQIQAGNKTVLEARQSATKTMTDAIQQNEDLRKQIGDKDEEFRKEIGKKDLAIRNLTTALKRQEELALNPNRSLGDPHSLILDISTGKPLWDTPRAKIVRVDESGKKLFIDKGSKDGIKPGLTFTVFASGGNGRGAGELKATVEVIRVEDAQTSLCKVNTFYDTDGREISVTDATPGRIFREGGSALKEGDLLFNLCWGTHVAIVGIVDFTGIEAKTPAAQMDALKEYMRYLERMGITIDSYTDLRDGKVVGDVGTKTNFVIRGASALKLKDTEDDKRVKAINSAITAVREQAVERGLFIISAENFAVVTGYRRPGSADDQQTSAFVPRRPAGPAQGQSNPEPTKKD